MMFFRTPRHCLMPCLFLVASVSVGCGLFAVKTGPQIEETPPYYQSETASHHSMDYHAEQRDEMAREARVFRQTELEKLEMLRENERKEAENQQRRDAKQSKKSKSGFWGRLGGDDFLMSETAREINSNLEAKSANAGLER